VDCYTQNKKLLQWWQQRGYHKHPHVKVAKDVGSLPESVVDSTGPPKQGRSSKPKPKKAGAGADSL